MKEELDYSKCYEDDSEKYYDMDNEMERAVFSLILPHTHFLSGKQIRIQLHNNNSIQYRYITETKSKRRSLAGTSPHA